VTSTPPVIHVAAAVILDGQGRMLVVRKRQTSAFMQPGGKIMPGESARQAMEREVLEELGVAVDPATVTSLGRHVAAAAHEPGHTVEADAFRASLAAEPRAAAEIDEITWVDPANPGDIELAPLTKLLIEEAL
jgi:8-oxo-dGTP diphosphatase